jgi:hypothetical protein
MPILLSIRAVTLDETLDIRADRLMVHGYPPIRWLAALGLTRLTTPDTL